MKSNWKWKVFEGHCGVGYVVPDLLKFLEEENPKEWRIVFSQLTRIDIIYRN
jgi:hypothetical protein